MNFKTLIVLLYLLFCSTFITYSQSGDIMGIMGDTVVNDLEEEIKRVVRKHALYSYNIANVTTPGFSPLLYPEDQIELDKIVPENEEMFKKVLLEHMTTNMARNRNKHNAYLLIYKKRFEVYRQVASLGKK
tara:strand:- start:200 stop:592 length:393 start_codon:yes stop_codon:yes gene_type:complete